MTYHVLVVEDDPLRALEIAELRLPLISLHVVPLVQLRNAVATETPDIVYGPWYRRPNQLTEEASWLLMWTEQRARRTLFIPLPASSASTLKFIETTLRGFSDRACSLQTIPWRKA